MGGHGVTIRDSFHLPEMPSYAFGMPGMNVKLTLFSRKSGFALKLVRSA